MEWPCIFPKNKNMVEIIGNDKPVQHLPIGSLKGFGTTPFGDAIYRVIWSESRLAMCGGKHVVFDGPPSNDATVMQRGKDPNQVREEIGYKYIPVYPGIKAWILEKWKSAFASTGMTENSWNWQYKDPETGLLELGPYPIRGEYWHSYTFPSGHAPGILKVFEVIQMIQAGQNYSFAEHRQAILKNNAVQQKDWENRCLAMAQDALPVGGIRPVNLRPGKKSPERVINFNKGVEDLGLNPAHRGASIGAPTQRGK